MSVRTAGRRVVVFGLGGTIAMGNAGTDGVTPSLSASDLVDAVPGLAATGIGVQTVDFRRMSSSSLDFDDITELAAAIDGALDGGATGVVVTQGTNTIEEVSYLLDLGHTRTQPVVVTGAMRNPTLAGADGPANVLAAIQVAAADDTRGLGVLVVFADEIHAARRVRKTHTTSGNTFQSGNGGPLGYVVEGRPVVLHRPPVRLIGPPATPGRRPRIGLHTATFGDHGELLIDAVTRLDGLVIAAMGPGHLPDRLLDLVTGAAATMPVVLSSRTLAGPVLTGTYGFPGSERDLITRRLIASGFVDPAKARLLLYATLAAGADREQIAMAFAVAGGYLGPDRWPWRVIPAMAPA